VHPTPLPFAAPAPAPAHQQGFSLVSALLTIAVLGVLGQVDRASDAYAKAMAAHGSDRVSRAFLTEQAILAGVQVE